MGIFDSEEKTARRERKSDLDNSIADLEAELWRLNASVAELTNDTHQEGLVRNPQYAPKWEYILVDDVDEAFLDEKGRLGWELVGLSSYTTGFGIGGNSSMKVHIRFALKRPVAPLSDDMQASADKIEGLQKQIIAVTSDINDLTYERSQT